MLPWRLEVASLIASLMFFIAIIIVLHAFDGKSLPDLPLNVTLNAIVGPLATFGEFLLMVPVASAIGQIKWNRSLRKRPMSEFRILDEASRGPWGAFLLLVRTKGGILASFGAIITILGLATNTFVQQALKYQTFYPAGANASMPIAQYLNNTNFAPLNGFERGGNIAIDQGMVAALYRGLYSALNSKFTATAVCSGNCTRSSYQTLAFCNTCVDITSKLKQPKIHITPENKVARAYDTDYYTLPNGFALTGVQPAPPSLGNNDIPSIGLLNAQFDLLHFHQATQLWMTVIAIGSAPGSIPAIPDTELNEKPQLPPVAMECALQFCVRKMSASFANGLLNETIKSTWIDKSLDLNDIGNPEDSSGVVLTPPFKPSKRFVLASEAIVGTGHWLGTGLAGNTTMGTTQSKLDDFLSAGSQQHSSDILQAIYQSMNSSTKGMSLALSSSAYQPEPAVGIATSSTSHFVVRWAWLSLPLILLAASSIFLVVVIVETKKKGLMPWSNNILAVLFHGVGGGVEGRGVRDLQPLMEEHADDFMLEMRSDVDGGHLVASSRV
ncbi:hypothetical protein EJ08DRAFT_671200 [Tothia fuscella]|uniref:Uncharacterized protein n=1 Tax=Tothia fuscella TaxID=1048955 RepID=A0A9P4NPT2_9PEZI|nr:hypothetical protein EJ08DRAFT_671200 [Tothia fuscella]